MRCHDAKLLLVAQRNSDLDASDVQALQEHLSQCPICHAFEHRQHRIDSVFRDTPLFVPGTISTDRIMRAVSRQRTISRQLEDVRAQQQNRVAHMRLKGTVAIALSVFLLSCIPALIIALLTLQPGAVQAATPAFLGNIIDILIIVAQYVLTGLTLVTYNTWLLLAVAFAVVVMMGMWLRLMRYPQEA